MSLEQAKIAYLGKQVDGNEDDIKTLAKAKVCRVIYGRQMMTCELNLKRVNIVCDENGIIENLFIG